MENRDHDTSRLFQVGTPLCGLLLALVGAILGLLLVTRGFWATMLIALFALIGYYLGASRDKASRIKQFINKLFPPKGE